MSTASPIPASLDFDAIDRQASVLMKRGMAILRDGGAESAASALACFDGALAMRQRLPIDELPIFRYGLAACWLNRAEALLQAGDEASAALAIDACNEAVTLLRALRLEDDARFPRRLAIACQHRGLAMQAAGVSGASAAFTQALAVLDADVSSPIADRRYLLSAVCVNLANARVAESTFESDALARAAASRALEVVATLEDTVPDAAEVGLEARHVLCRMVARHMTRASVREMMTADDIHEATDLADDSLALVHHWERQGVVRFRDLALDLFQFGALVYGRYQPHFLPDFVLENLDPSRTSEGFAALIGTTPVARELQSQAGLIS